LFDRHITPRHRSVPANSNPRQYGAVPADPLDRPHADDLSANLSLLGNIDAAGFHTSIRSI
jgi:hypothetical protein